MFGKRLDALLVKYRLSIPENARREWIELMRHLATEEAKASSHQGISFQKSAQMAAFAPVELEKLAPLPFPSERITSPAFETAQGDRTERTNTTLIESSPRKKSQKVDFPMVFSTKSMDPKKLDAWNRIGAETTNVEGLPTISSFPPDMSAQSYTDSVDIDFIPNSSSDLSPRYEDLGMIAQGGMGEIRRVKDRELNRTVAMKVLRSKWLNHPEVMIRFLEEAQATAQLHHPGVVTVHELGYLPDGRIYFTMEEIQGQTLSEEIQDFHVSLASGGHEKSHNESLHQLLKKFQKICETVGWAHERGIVHRDLKPENIMIGQLGEVLVIDWGLARIADRPDEMTSIMAKQEQIQTHRSNSEQKSLDNNLGEVIGTPAYMPPEQARGELEQLGPASDIYALGAILYEMLSGRPPYDGETFARILYQVLEGPPPPPTPYPPTSDRFTQPEGYQVENTPKATYIPANLGASEQQYVRWKYPNWEAPEAIIRICKQAMARTPEERYPDAHKLAMEISDWLRTSADLCSPQEALNTAKQKLEAIKQYQRQETLLRRQAKEILQEIQSYQPESKKEYGWSLEEEAMLIQQKAELEEFEVLHLLRTILQQHPEHAETRKLLLNYCQVQHQQAEHLNQKERCSRYEKLLRAYDKGHSTSYLQGMAQFSIDSVPSGAQVTLYSYQTDKRRPTLQKEKELGTTPLRDISLPVGSHLLKIKSETSEEIIFPLQLKRSEQWQHTRPNEADEQLVLLPKIGSLSNDELYIPGSLCWVGGDSDAPNSLHKQKIWIDDFVIKETPITHEQYLLFLNDLISKNREKEAMQWAAQRREGPGTQVEKLLYHRNEEGLFELREAAHLVRWKLFMPVTMIDWFAATAWSEWHAEQTGLPWRLPCEFEWEKAARGTDARHYPWGHWLDPTWCCMQQSHAGEAQAASVHSYPIDTSPYGAKGMAGNVREWCADRWSPNGANVVDDQLSVPTENVRELLSSISQTKPIYHVTKGGSWIDSSQFCRIAARRRESPFTRTFTIGFRVVRSLTPATDNDSDSKPDRDSAKQNKHTQDI